MKQKFTNLIMAMLLVMGMSNQLFAQDGNFTSIDDFEEGTALWWLPDGSGSTAGIVLENAEGDSVTYNAAETVIVNPETGSTGSFKLAIQWENDAEYTGVASHLVRQHMPASNANTVERRFQPGQALEVFLYGDGSGNRFRFMTRDGAPTLEGSPWINIDWTGWKRIVWDYNRPDNVVAWVNGDGKMDGENYYFDSFQITKDEGGTAQGATLYFDDFRIVDPFTVDFNIAGASGTEVISINNTSYANMQTGFTLEPETFDAGVTSLNLFPGTYQYFVQKEGSVTETGTFVVDDQNLVIDVTFEAGVDPLYTVTFSVFDQDEELVTDAVIAVDSVANAAGDYAFELAPGFYSYTINKDLYFETSGYFTVVDGNLFVTAVLNEIPDIFDNVFLSWDVAPTASTPAYREEQYSVWVAVVDDALQQPAPEDFEMVFEETLTQDMTGYVLQSREIEISEFQSQNIRVAFRHNGSTNMDRVILDNVRIEAHDLVNDSIAVLLSEDFEGGVPADFDPIEDETVVYDEEWLPMGWYTLNNDTDTLDWYYAIRLVQGGYETHMGSQSFANDTPLTPDNWLVTSMVEMPMVLFHTVTFDVKDADGAAITDAIITFGGETFDAGVYEFVRTSGSYDYEVVQGDFVPATGTLNVGRGDTIVDITLVMPTLYDVTFNVDMREHDAFVAGETEVYMTGTILDWDNSVPGTFPEQKMDPTDNVFFFTKNLQLEAGTYTYKYFDGPTFDDAEWAGEPFRTLVVESDTVVDDVFGIQVAVDEAQMSAVKLYPNPATSQVKISSPANISMISIYNIAGQQVYQSRPVDTNLTISLSGYEEGIYMVRIMTAEGVKTYKLQVVK